MTTKLCANRRSVDEDDIGRREDIADEVWCVVNIVEQSSERGWTSWKSRERGDDEAEVDELEEEARWTVKMLESVVGCL